VSMTDISRLKRELASRHLYDSGRGKDKELTIVSGFLKRFQLNPDAITKGERPDFFISLANDELNLGIELTRLNADTQHPGGGSPERKVHSKWKTVAHALRSRLSIEPKPLPHVYGSVFFRIPSKSVLSNLDQVRFCEEIVTTLRGTSFSELGSEIVNFHPASTPLLASVVNHIFVRVFPAETELLWWCSDLQSGVVADPYAALKATVAKKQRKANSYNWRNAHERWLLIYAAGEGLADMTPNLEDPEIGEATPFTYVFLWDKFSETIYCLSPRFATVFTAGNTLHVRHLPPSIRPSPRRSQDNA
jgi:hypothetical protein